MLGFYTREDLPGYHHLADEYVLFDHFFQAMSGGSTGNALYLAAARSAEWSQPPRARSAASAPPVFDKPYDKTGILINDVPPMNGPTEVFMGLARSVPAAGGTDLSQHRRTARGGGALLGLVQ